MYDDVLNLHGQVEVARLAMDAEQAHIVHVAPRMLLGIAFVRALFGGEAVDSRAVVVPDDARQRLALDNAHTREGVARQPHLALAVHVGIEINADCRCPFEILPHQGGNLRHRHANLHRHSPLAVGRLLLSTGNSLPNASVVATKIVNYFYQGFPDSRIRRTSFMPTLDLA